MSSPLEILKTYWDYNNFRTPQEEIIKATLQKKDTLVLLPTGGGKSLCYQVPTLVLEGICIVISPLIALIQDQVNSLKKRNIKAIALTSQLSNDELITAFDNLRYGNFKFLYLSPEKLQSPFILEKIKQLHVSIIAIDEAHCISEWGHDFRPSYLKLKILKEIKPSATFMALTATATKKVLEDIELNLELTKPVVFKKSFKRTNLNYSVISTENIYGKLLQISKKIKESIIIYTSSRKETEDVCKMLIKNNFKSSFYHGGLSSNEKNSSFNNWMFNKTPIMVATNAFGMGIDKANVRAVIHINTPNSLENYIQESGRAGRDGKPSFSLILTNKTNLYNAGTNYTSNTPSVKYVKQIYEHLNQYYSIILGELPTQSFDFSLQEFCYAYKLKLLITYNSIKILERENIIRLDENYTKKSSLKILVSSKQLFDFTTKNPSKNNLINLILRSYGGIFEHDTTINEYFLSKKLNCSKKEIIAQLTNLNEIELVKYSHQNTNSKLLFLVARDVNYTMNSISKNIKLQNNLKYKKLQAVISYINNTSICRNIQLLAYFNEVVTENCGTCDVCKQKNHKIVSVEQVSKHILNLLKHNTLSSEELLFKLDFSKDEVINSLKMLLEKNKITITSQNKFKHKL
jgi:ATP-dependent DNA helicase RecQ